MEKLKEKIMRKVLSLMLAVLMIVTGIPMDAVYATETTEGSVTLNIDDASNLDGIDFLNVYKEVERNGETIIGEEVKNGDSVEIGNTLYVYAQPDDNHSLTSVTGVDLTNDTPPINIKVSDEINDGYIIYSCYAITVERDAENQSTFTITAKASRNKVYVYVSQNDGIKAFNVYKKVEEDGNTTYKEVEDGTIFEIGSTLYVYAEPEAYYSLTSITGVSNLETATTTPITVDGKNYNCYEIELKDEGSNDLTIQAMADFNGVRVDITDVNDLEGIKTLNVYKAVKENEDNETTIYKEVKNGDSVEKGSTLYIYVQEETNYILRWLSGVDLETATIVPITVDNNTYNCYKIKLEDSSYINISAHAQSNSVTVNIEDVSDLDEIETFKVFKVKNINDETITGEEVKNGDSLTYGSTLYVYVKVNEGYILKSVTGVDLDKDSKTKIKVDGVTYDCYTITIDEFYSMRISANAQSNKVTAKIYDVSELYGIEALKVYQAVENNGETITGKEVENGEILTNGSTLYVYVKPKTDYTLERVTGVDNLSDALTVKIKVGDNTYNCYKITVEENSRLGDEGYFKIQASASSDYTTVTIADVSTLTGIETLKVYKAVGLDEDDETITGEEVKNGDHVDHESTLYVYVKEKDEYTLTSVNGAHTLSNTVKIKVGTKTYDCYVIQVRSDEFTILAKAGSNNATINIKQYISGIDTLKVYKAVNSDGNTTYEKVENGDTFYKGTTLYAYVEPKTDYTLKSVTGVTDLTDTEEIKVDGVPYDCYKITVGVGTFTITAATEFLSNGPYDTLRFYSKGLDVPVTIRVTDANNNTQIVTLDEDGEDNADAACIYYNVDDPEVERTYILTLDIDDPYYLAWMFRAGDDEYVSSISITENGLGGYTLTLPTGVNEFSLGLWSYEKNPASKFDLTVDYDKAAFDTFTVYQKKDDTYTKVSSTTDLPKDGKYYIDAVVKDSYKLTATTGLKTTKTPITVGTGTDAKIIECYVIDTTKITNKALTVSFKTRSIEHKVTLNATDDTGITAKGLYVKDNNGAYTELSSNAKLKEGDKVYVYVNVKEGYTFSALNGTALKDIEQETVDNKTYYAVNIPDTLEENKNFEITAKVYSTTVWTVNKPSDVWGLKSTTIYQKDNTGKYVEVTTKTLTIEEVVDGKLYVAFTLENTDNFKIATVNGKEAGDTVNVGTKETPIKAYEIDLVKGLDITVTLDTLKWYVPTSIENLETFTFYKMEENKATALEEKTFVKDNTTLYLVASPKVKSIGSTYEIVDINGVSTTTTVTYNSKEYDAYPLTVTNKDFSVTATTKAELSSVTLDGFTNEKTSQTIDTTKTYALTVNEDALVSDIDTTKLKNATITKGEDGKYFLTVTVPFATDELSIAFYNKNANTDDEALSTYTVTPSAITGLKDTTSTVKFEEADARGFRVTLAANEINVEDLNNTAVYYMVEATPTTGTTETYYFKQDGASQNELVEVKELDGQTYALTVQLIQASEENGTYKPLTAEGFTGTKSTSVSGFKSVTDKKYSTKVTLTNSVKQIYNGESFEVTATTASDVTYTGIEAYVLNAYNTEADKIKVTTSGSKGTYTVNVDVAESVEAGTYTLVVASDSGNAAPATATLKFKVLASPNNFSVTGVPSTVWKNSKKKVTINAAASFDKSILSKDKKVTWELYDKDYDTENNTGSKLDSSIATIKNGKITIPKNSTAVDGQEIYVVATSTSTAKNAGFASAKFTITNEVAALGNVYFATLDDKNYVPVEVDSKGTTYTTDAAQVAKGFYLVVEDSDGNLYEQDYSVTAPKTASVSAVENDNVYKVDAVTAFKKKLSFTIKSLDGTSKKVTLYVNYQELDTDWKVSVDGTLVSDKKKTLDEYKGNTEDTLLVEIGRDDGETFTKYAGATGVKVTVKGGKLVSDSTLTANQYKIRITSKSATLTVTNPTNKTDNYVITIPNSNYTGMKQAPAVKTSANSTVIANYAGEQSITYTSKSAKTPIKGYESVKVQFSTETYVKDYAKNGENSIYRKIDKAYQTANNTTASLVDGVVVNIDKDKDCFVLNFKDVISAGSAKFALTYGTGTGDSFTASTKTASVTMKFVAQTKLNYKPTAKYTFKSESATFPLTGTGKNAAYVTYDKSVYNVVDSKGNVNNFSDYFEVDEVDGKLAIKIKKDKYQDAKNLKKLTGYVSYTVTGISGTQYAKITITVK